MAGGSAWGFSVVLTANSLALITATFPAGILADHVSRRRLMITADIGRAALVGVVPVAYYTKGLTLGLLATVSALSGLFTVFFSVANQSHLPDLVGSTHLLEARAKLGSAGFLSGVVGTALGGALVGMIGAPAALALDAVSYLASAGAVMSLRTPEPKRSASVRLPWRGELLSGMKFTFTHPALRSLTACSGTISFVARLTLVVEVVFLVQKVHATPLEVGTVLAVPCLGGLMGARVTPRLVRKLGFTPVLVTAAAAEAPMIFCVGLVPVGVPGLLAVSAVWTVLLFAAGIYNAAQSSARQAFYPAAMRGRGTAADRFVLEVLRAIAAASAGLLVGFLGLRQLFFVGGALAATAPLWLICPALRKCEVRLSNALEKSAGQTGSRASELAT